MLPTISILLIKNIAGNQVFKERVGLEFRESITEGTCFIVDFLKECYAQTTPFNFSYPCNMQIPFPTG